MHLFCLSLCSIDFYTNHFLLDDALWSSSETTAVCACCKDLPAQPHIATFQLLSLPRNCQYHGHTNFTSRRTALHLNQSITMGIFEKLQARLELYRLEQRYTRREKRTTFISDAQYVDGEYVYSSSPSSTKSSSAGSNRRFSKMPTIGIKELKMAGTGRS